jgi:hypothetical protein
MYVSDQRVQYLLSHLRFVRKSVEVELSADWELAERVSGKQEGKRHARKNSLGFVHFSTRGGEERRRFNEEI